MFAHSTVTHHGACCLNYILELQKAGGSHIHTHPLLLWGVGVQAILLSVLYKTEAGGRGDGKSF